MKTEYTKRKGVVIVDGQESAAVNVPGDGNTLDVDGKLYLGGLPLAYAAKKMGNVSFFSLIVLYVYCLPGKSGCITAL